MELSDDMQHQAKALADPSRFRLFRHIVESDHPVGVAELTALLEFNHNAIRQHLAVLVGAGLVTESDEVRKVRGRPRKQYAARLDAMNAFRSVSGSYQHLAELLLEVVGSGAGAYEVGFRAGQRAAAADSAVPAAAAKPVSDTSAEADDDQLVVDGLIRQLALHGFEPDPVAERSVSLTHCPFADVAARDPGVVCELHRGLIDGHLAASNDDLVGDLTVEEPHRAGCLVQIRSRGGHG